MWVEETKVELAVSQLGIVKLEGSQEGLLKGSIIWISIKEMPGWTVIVSQGSSAYQQQTTKVSHKEERLILPPSYLPHHSREGAEARKQKKKEVTPSRLMASTFHSTVGSEKGSKRAHHPP